MASRKVAIIQKFPAREEKNLNCLDNSALGMQTWIHSLDDLFHMFHLTLCHNIY